MDRVYRSKFVLNILEGATSGRRAYKTWTTEVKASRQKHSSWQLYNNETMALQQFKMESCQPIKGL
jgi:hypothetical protein